MPTCKEITEQSSDYLDRNLSFLEKMNFRIHIFICVNCKRYVSQLKLTIATIGKSDGANPLPVEDRQVEDIVDRLKKVEP